MCACSEHYTIMHRSKLDKKVRFVFLEQTALFGCFLMLEKAEQNGCQAETKLQIPENWYEGNFSFCVILGNLLDNAIREAAGSEEKRLFVGICEKQGVVMIQIKNSCREKSEGEREGDHGYGIENVERVVKSLDGEFTHEQGEGWYEANVMLYSRNIREGVTA